MADVESRPIRWLWPGRIALGRISLLVGMPGAGKSFLTCDMAARVSTGQQWPDGSRCERGSVLLVTAEDDPGDTIRPRLDAQGADVSRDSPAGGITSAGNRRQQCRVDLLAGRRRRRSKRRSSTEGLSVDRRRPDRLVSWAPVLTPIATTKCGPCSHPWRSSPSSTGQRCWWSCIAGRADAVADDTAMGSRAFTGIARSVWHLSRDSENRDRRLLLPGKSNLTKEQSGLAFAIAGDPGAVQWERDPVKMTADDAMAQGARRPGRRFSARRSD